MNNIPQGHYFMLRNPNKPFIKQMVEIDAPTEEYYDDDRIKFLIDEDSDPFYEYPGVLIPAYLKFTDNGIEVYSGERIGWVSESCEEYVHDLFFYKDCQCQVGLYGGMCVNRIGDEIYREFDDYHAILEISV